jgi:hypothetical protein
MAAANVPAAIEADVLCCGYNVGFFDKSDIVRWADSQIAAMDKPSDALLDLAMIRDAHPLDVIKLLKTIRVEPASADSIATQIGFIGICFTKSRITLRAAIRGLYALTREPGTSPDQSSTIYWLDDAYDLAIAGTYGSLDDVEAGLRNFVVPYTARLYEHHRQLIDRT